MSRIKRYGKESFRQLAEQSPNMIFINHKGENIYVNKRCEEIMGYTKDELCAPDFSFLQLIAPENHTRQMQNLSAHFRGEDVTPSTFTVFD